MPARLRACPTAGCGYVGPTAAFRRVHQPDVQRHRDQRRTCPNCEQERRCWAYAIVTQTKAA